MPVTLQDVAAAAGVSQATAARALNNYGSVSAGAKERVLKAAADLGYETNHVAQALRSGNTRTVNFLPGNIGAPFFARIAHILSGTLEEAGYVLAVSSSYEQVERERSIIESMRARMSPGLIVAPAHRDLHEHLQRLQQRGTAVVAIDRSLAERGIDSITVDNYALGTDAAAHLITLGHRTIGLIYDSDDIGSTPDRVRGAAEAITATGGTVVAVQAGTDLDVATTRISERLAQSSTGPSAVIAMDALMTEATISAIRQLDLRIPTDLSLVAVDDHSLARLLDPPLTVMAQPVDQIGQDAAALMIRRLEDERIDEVVDLRHRAELIVRGSTARRD